jgi:predicted RNase H-like nuclease
MNDNIALKIIELHEAIDSLVTESMDGLEPWNLEEINQMVEGAEKTCEFFQEEDNIDRIIYELTTLHNWLILYIRGVIEF